MWGVKYEEMCRYEIDMGPVDGDISFDNRGKEIKLIYEDAFKLVFDAFKSLTEQNVKLLKKKEMKGRAN